MSKRKRKSVQWADQAVGQEHHEADGSADLTGAEPPAPDGPALADSTNDNMDGEGEVYTSVLERDVEVVPPLGS